MEAELSGPDEIQNSFTVSFAYRVLFRDNVLDPANGLLAGLLTADDAALPARAAIFIDAGLHRADRRLAQRVTRYFQAHHSRIVLSADPHVVAGGEAAKNDPAVFY